MKKIGILCASDTELAPFLDRIRVRSTSEEMVAGILKALYSTRI